MGYFAQLREKQSSFYRRLWQEISEIKVIDTHEHLQTISALTPDLKPPIPVFNLFDCSYIYQLKGDYTAITEQLQHYRGTGYLRSWLIAMEDLYGLEGPITPKYVAEMEQKINGAYADDIAHNTNRHLESVLKKNMHVDRVINNIRVDEQRNLPSPLIQHAAGIPSILEGMLVPKSEVSSENVVYWYAYSKLGKKPEEVRNLADYCDLTDKFLQFVKESGKFMCFKLQTAYRRPIRFPEPPDNEKIIQNLFNKPPRSEEEFYLFGDFMFHHILEWAASNWRKPFQIHTGLAWMFDGGSNALNLSYLFQKFPDIHFDLFHGNYPYNNLAGMLHQIRNISADLCWLPAISPTAAQRNLVELFEVGDMVADMPYHQPGLRTSLFGGDSRLVEGSYGGLQLAKDVLIRALEDLYTRGHIFEQDAIALAENVLYHNPKRIFSL